MLAKLCCVCSSGGFSANSTSALSTAAMALRLTASTQVTAQAARSVWRCQWRWFDDTYWGSQRSAIMLARAMLCLAHQEDSVPTSTSALSTAAMAFKINGIDTYDRSGFQSVQQAMSMAMALMTSLLGLLPIPTVKMCWRELCCVWLIRRIHATST